MLDVLWYPGGVIAVGTIFKWIPRGQSAPQIRVARLLSHVRVLWFADDWTVGAYVYLCSVAGLAVSHSLGKFDGICGMAWGSFPWTKFVRQWNVWWIEGSQVASGLMPAALANLHVARLSGGVFGVSLGCSVLSRVLLDVSCLLGGGSLLVPASSG